MTYRTIGRREGVMRGLRGNVMIDLVVRGFDGVV